MRYLYAIVLFAAIASAAKATTPGAKTMYIWNPASYEWSIDPVLTRLSAVSDGGYSVSYTNVPVHYSEQGTVPANWVRDTVLGGDRGILMFTGLHGHGHPDKGLLGVWYEENHRDNDLAAMNAQSNVYKAFDDYFMGITITASGASGQFSDNTTLVFDDGCSGFGFIDGLGATSYCGWSDTVTLETANTETTSLFNSMGYFRSDLNTATMFITMEAGGDLTLKLDVNPAASVSGFGVADGMARWEAIPFRTDQFIVEGGDDPVNGPWEELVGVEPHPDDEHYAVPVSTEQYPYFRLTEIETGGHRLYLGHAEADATSAGLSPATPVTRESLEVRLAAFSNERDSQGLTTSFPLLYGEGKAAVFFTRDDWIDEVQEYVADYWHDEWGVTTYVEGVDAYPVPEPDNRDAWRAHMKARIQYFYNELNVRYVHFIGGANDWEMWSQDWPEGEWADYKDYYNRIGYPSEGQPELDHIPTYYMLDDTGPDVNTAGWTWWIPSDSEYKKLDDGTTLDIALGRWPVNSAEGILAWAATMQQYNDRGIVDTYHNVEIWTGELPFSAASDSIMVMDAAFATGNEVPSSIPLSFMNEQQFPDVGVRNLEAARRLNQDEITVLGLLASNSGRRYPGKQFDNSHYLTPFTMDLLRETVDTPYIIGASCGTADYQRTGKPTAPGPICEVMGEAPNKGFIAMLGAMCGTWQQADHQISVYAMRELWEGNNAAAPRSLAMSWASAEEALRQDFSGDYGLQRTLLSYVFLGDPLSPLRRPARVCGVSDNEVVHQTSLDAAYPNPFNPSTNIRFVTSRSGAVRLVIFDLRGREVRTLVDEILPSGQHYVVWHGDDNSGHRVASGTYLFRLKTRDKTVSRKMTIVE